MRTLYLIAAAMLLPLAGCGDDLNLVPVHGVVTLDGKPLAFKNLMFVPEDGTAGNGAGGYTNGKGEYSLIAVVFGATSDHDGIPPGKYRVVVLEPTIPITEADFADPTALDEGDEAAPAMAPAMPTQRTDIPRAYSSESTTPLVVDVPEGGGELNLELDSKPA